MKIKIAKSALLPKLQYVAKVAGSKTVEIMNDVLLHATDKGLFLTGTNGDGAVTAVIAPESVEIVRMGKVSVKASKVAEMVYKTVTDLFLEEKDGSLIVKSGKSNFKISLGDYELYPAFPEKKGEVVTLDAGELKRIIKKTMFATAETAATPILTGVRFQIGDGHLIATGCDRHRLSRISVECETDVSTSVVISRSSLKDILDILEDGEEVNVHIDVNSLHIETAEYMYYSRVLDGSYPDTERLLPKEFANKAEFSTKDFANAVERALIVAKEEKTSIIKLKTHETGLIVSAEVEGEQFYEVVEAKFENDFVLTCNGGYVLEALKTIDQERTILGCNGAMNPFVMWGVGSNDNQLVLPYRTK